MFLLDTNIISYLARDPKGNVAKRVASNAGLSTSVIVIGEIAFGFAKTPSERLETQVVTILRGIDILDLDQDVATAYGSIRADLEKVGKRIGNNNLWIAAHALALDATLITANEGEFRRVRGLRIENWADPQA